MREIVRKRILEKYNNKCVHCGTTINLQIDHIIPLSKNGRHDENNLQVLCRTCNLKKGKGVDFNEYFKTKISKDYILISDNFPVKSLRANEILYIIENKFRENNLYFREK